MECWWVLMNILLTNGHLLCDKPFSTFAFIPCSVFTTFNCSLGCSGTVKTCRDVTEHCRIVRASLHTRCLSLDLLELGQWLDIIINEDYFFTPSKRAIHGDFHGWHVGNPHFTTSVNDVGGSTQWQKGNSLEHLFRKRHQTALLIWLSPMLTRG